MALELLARGFSADEALKAVVAGTPHRHWRQLAIVDANGRTVALRFFHVPAFRGELINTQFQALAWVEAAQLTQYEFLEGDLDFVTALARGEWAHVFRAERS